MNEIETKIRSAIDVCRARGLRIKPGGWGIGDEGGRYAIISADICPMAAVILATGVHAAMDMMTEAAYTLGVSTDWVADFVQAFDGTSNGFRENVNAVAIGQRLRYEAIYGVPVGERPRYESFYGPMAMLTTIGVVS